MQQWGRKPERKESVPPARALAEKVLPEGRRKASDEILAFAGVHAYRAGRLREALDMFRGALDDNPKNATAWLYMGMMQREVGDPEKGVRCISEAIRLEPENAMAYAERADAYLRMKNFVKAGEDSVKSISLDPDHANAYVLLGNCRYAEGKDWDALVAFAKYCELVPGDDEGRQRYEEYHRKYLDASRPKTALFTMNIMLPKELPDGTVLAGVMQVPLLVTYQRGENRDGA